jgi:ammonia channel protein AmtB|tara:strand:+ start:348 stop:533 length:186 start_codon:yes stop_codon:yes gene_type:complete
MPLLSEIQELAPLFFQLLFFIVAGAILVGSFIAIIRLMYKFSLVIFLIIVAFFLYNYGNLW